jgi:hypothetical protein
LIPFTEAGEEAAQLEPLGQVEPKSRATAKPDPKRVETEVEEYELTGEGLTPLARAIRFLARLRKNPVSEARARMLARYFRRYGKLWNVDPWLAITIACQESIFRDHPPKILVHRCRTVVRRGEPVRRCRKVWPGERGLMQIIPVYSEEAFFACEGRRWDRKDELIETRINVCAGIWTLAARRKALEDRQRINRAFIVRGSDRNWMQRFVPCGPYQLRFCRNNEELCRRFWWVASYNWGVHRVICSRTSRKFNFSAYPIRIIKLYKLIVSKFRKETIAPDTSLAEDKGSEWRLLQRTPSKSARSHAVAQMEPAGGVFASASGGASSGGWQPAGSDPESPIFGSIGITYWSK